MTLFGFLGGDGAFFASSFFLALSEPERFSMLRVLTLLADAASSLGLPLLPFVSPSGTRSLLLLREKVSNSVLEPVLGKKVDFGRSPDCRFCREGIS